MTALQSLPRLPFLLIRLHRVTLTPTCRQARESRQLFSYQRCTVVLLYSIPACCYVSCIAGLRNLFQQRFVVHQYTSRARTPKLLRLLHCERQRCCCWGMHANKERSNYNVFLILL